MDFRTRRVLLGTPFVMIYEFFAFKYFFSLFMTMNDLYLIPLIVILEATHIIPTFTERKKSSKIGRYMSTFYGVYEWFLMMLFLYLVIFYGIGAFVVLPTSIYLMALAVIIAVGVYAYVHAHKIIIKEHVLEFDKIDKEYNILHFSDVHFGSVRHKELIMDLSCKIQEVEDKCDLVIISGDLTDGSSVIEEDDMMALKNITIPVIFTSGNHDYYRDIESVHRACQKANIIILENDSYEYEDLNIYGLSYSFGDIPMPTRDELKSAVKEDKLNIINFHIPNGWDEFTNMGFDIQLSGHTHGGQFYPVIPFGKLIYEGHNMGLFKKVINNKNHYLHVTTGVGSMDVPMRWGTDSELVILKLIKTN